MMLKWIGIFICLFHSAIFSGLNLGFFGQSRLKLFVQAKNKNQDARRILSLRKDAHFLLATLLWGNVASNVLLALLAESVMTGLGAFLFSTIFITFLGEIFPQAYLSKHALKTSSILVPVVKLYQVLLYPLAKPTGTLLDKWLGKEQITYFQEQEIEILLESHAKNKLTDLEHMETIGAINFLRIDDIKVEHEGEIINPKSIIQLPLTEKGLPVFPSFEEDEDDEFLQKVHISQEKWIIFTDPEDNPVLVLNADQFLRDVLYGEPKSIFMYCHRPIVIREKNTLLGEVILQLKVRPEHKEDDVVDNDLILYWGHEKRIITGADILGRLLRGIVKRETVIKS